VEVLSGDAAGIARAAALLRGGEVVGFPTDTVYGLAVLAGDMAAAERVYEAKGRPRDRPLVLMLPSAAGLGRWAAADARALALARRWWPGPLTLVLPARAGGGTIGVRVPDHALALALLREVGEGLLTTSANRSGEPPALDAAGVAALPGVAAVLDGGRSPGGVASTVLDLAGAEPRVLRQGPLNEDLLRRTWAEAGRGRPAGGAGTVL
jgi:L-threonylcarbamoyladenylate synthase